jgi:hypothetical protein
MIEINRYVRLKPQGLVRFEVTKEHEEVGIKVIFKRFDVETGKEIDPEISFVSFAEVDGRLSEMEKQIEVLREFSALRPR